jgi:hypothetical protein
MSTTLTAHPKFTPHHNPDEWCGEPRSATSKVICQRHRDHGLPWHGAASGRATYRWATLQPGRCGQESPGTPALCVLKEKHGPSPLGGRFLHVGPDANGRVWAWDDRGEVAK